MNILVAGGDSSNNKELSALVEKLGGYIIFNAADDKEALKTIKNNNIHIVITELVKEGVDGVELCRQIRSGITKQNYIYIIILTAKEEKEHRIAGYEAGADIYLEKPPDIAELNALIKIGIRINKSYVQKSPNQLHSIETRQEKEKPVEKIDRREVVLARIAADNKLVTPKQLAEAFSLQHQRRLEGQNLPIGDILIEKKMISEAQLKALRVAQKQKLSKRFCDIVVDKKIATRGQVVKAMNIQAKEFEEKKTCRRVGDILVDIDAITKEERNQIRLELEKPKQVSPATLDKTEQTEKNEKVADESDRTETNELESPKTEPDNIKKHHLFRLTVSDDKMEAHLSLTEKMTTPVSVDDVKTFLSENNITYGIVPDSQIAVFLKKCGETPIDFLVAGGDPPVEGEDAYIKYNFDENYLQAGEIKDDGSIDFKERGGVPKVKEGDLIAEKIPLKPGQQGTDIYSNVISVDEPNDVKINCDQGTVISEDGLSVTAKIGGQPNVTMGGILSVFSELTIKGDVDFETGNIDYNGNIYVGGTVKDGFIVKGGTLTAKEILGATIHSKGSVVVSGGIIGANIQAEGQVYAKFIKDGNIKAYGDVIVQKEILDSKIRTSNACKSQKIISSLVGSKLGIEAKEIGTDVSPPCTIKIGVDEHIKKIVQGFERTGAEYRNTLEETQILYNKLVQDKTDFQANLADSIQIQEELMKTRNALEEKIESSKSEGKEDKSVEEALKKAEKNAAAIEKTIENHLKTQDQLDEKICIVQNKMEKTIANIEDLNESKSKVMEWSQKKKGLATLKVAGSIHSKTKIIGPHASLILKEQMKNVTVLERRIPDSVSDWEIKINKKT